MKIGVIGAMAVEVELLKQKMNITHTSTVAGMEFCEGTIGDTETVIVMSGIGKVNAAVCAEILIGIFGVTHLLNTGIAGSLNPNINIGDLVISVDAVEHDFDIAAFGRAPGEIPGFDVLGFPADETLRRTALKAVQEAAPECKVIEGRIASGDQFIDDKEKKNWIRDTFHADCTEMEGAAIAQTAYLNKVPFVIIRAISDNAGSGEPMEYATFEKQAAEHCAGIVIHVLEELGR